MQITTTGIVLREREHDDDRILTILTADRGVITAYARGAKKLRGRLLSGTELLCCSRFVLFQYRDRYQVDSAETEQNFFGLRSDVESCRWQCTWHSSVPRWRRQRRRPGNSCG